MLLNCGVGEDSIFQSTVEHQSVLKEINPEYSWEGLMLKFKFQYYGHLMWRADSLEKTVMLGKIEVRRRRQQRKNGWMASLTQWTWVWTSSRRWWRDAWHAAVHGIAKSQTQLRDWITRNLGNWKSDVFTILCLWMKWKWGWEWSKHIGSRWLHPNKRL